MGEFCKVQGPREGGAATSVHRHRALKCETPEAKSLLHIAQRGAAQ